MKRHLAFLLSAVVALANLTFAAELNLTVTSDGQSVVTVDPGAQLPWQVTGQLSSAADNAGLSFFIFNLSLDPAGGILAPAGIPTSGPLLSFVPPQGFSNPNDGYGGTLVGDSLVGLGGAQNTLKSSLMNGPVVTGVGHAPIVLASGTLTAPTAGGLYTLKASDVLARVIQDGDDGSGPTWLTAWAFEGAVEDLQIIVTGSCSTFASCADVDQDGIRDDNCLWWACDAGMCQATPIAFADMGGQFGSCVPDGTADGNDRFHALNCFANVTTDGSAGYPCEGSPPSALNVDAGGPFGNCTPDGVCDGNDAFHALNAFQGTTLCSCPGGPAPAYYEPDVAGKVAVVLRARQRTVRPGDLIQIDILLGSALTDLRGYQLHLGVTGGECGSLKLVDIAIEDRTDWVYAGHDAWQAFNAHTGQMVAGLESAGVPVAAGAYLATFTYRAAVEASGTFVVGLLLDKGDRSHRTFIFPTRPNSRIDVATVEAQLTIAVNGRVGRRSHQ